MILDIVIPDITNYMIEIFLLLMLGIMALIDVKKRQFPAPLTSGILFMIAVVNYQNIQFGILAFILAIFLFDLETFSGMADIKLLTAIGFIIPNLGMFLLLTIILLIFSTVYQTLMVKFLKKKQGEEYAYIPVLFFTYLTILLVMVL